MPMFSEKSLFAYVEKDVLPCLNVDCTKAEFKTAWLNRGLGQQLMKVVRSTVNSRAQAIRTQATANFGQIFRVKPKQGQQLMEFYSSVRDKISLFCNPHDKVAWNKWESMIRRAYCVPLAWARQHFGQLRPLYYRGARGVRACLAHLVFYWKAMSDYCKCPSFIPGILLCYTRISIVILVYRSLIPR